MIAILGMHRSGTSWLAGSLQQRGLELGEVSEKNRYNPKGNREPRELVRIQERVFRDCGGNALAPPQDIQWSDERKAQLRTFIDGMSARHDIWGFKDPRTVLMLEQWFDFVPDLELVGIFRNPLAVHGSLQQRSANIEQALALTLELWVRYNQALVETHQRRWFPLIQFDVEPASLQAQLDLAVSALGLDAAPTEASFFEGALVHHETGDGDIPASCQEVWDYLTANSLHDVPTGGKYRS